MSTDILSKLVIKHVKTVITMYTEASPTMRHTDRDTWALVLKYEGKSVYHSQGKEFFSDNLHPVLLPAGCSYDWKCTESGHFTFLEFECDARYTSPISFSLRNGDAFFRMIKELEYKRDLLSPTSDMESIRDLYSIILTLTASEQRQYIPGRDEKRISPALEYLAKHYTEHITNEKLADVCSMSTVYFRKTFTKVTGLSPISYLRSYKVNMAKKMLAAEHSSLTDVAISAGFSGIYDFSRTFKALTGLSPSQYRNELITSSTIE